MSRENPGLGHFSPVHSGGTDHAPHLLLIPSIGGCRVDPVSEAARAKEAAGEQAAAGVESGMILGLGTGSTVAYFLEALGRRIREGSVTKVAGVPTSVRTRDHARRLGIPLLSLPEAGALDYTVDGADEVDPVLDLIKGLGGALLREKMVAQATRHLTIIVDDGKVVDRLGTRAPLPVEVVPFGWEAHIPFLSALGCHPTLRGSNGATPFATDNGNFILDCRFPMGIQEPRAVEEALRGRAGVVETGLFLGMTSEVLVGSNGGQVLRKVVGGQGSS